MADRLDERAQMLDMLLAKIGLKLCHSSTSSNWHLVCIDSGQAILEKTREFSFWSAWEMAKDDAAAMLLDEILEFGHQSDCLLDSKMPFSSSIKAESTFSNPYYGCRSLEEALVQADLVLPAM